MPVHEDEHSRESVRRSFEHETGDHFARTPAQTRGDANPANARAEQVDLIYGSQDPGATGQMDSLSRDFKRVCKLERLFGGRELVMRLVLPSAQRPWLLAGLAPR